MDKNARVSRRSREAVFDLEPVVTEAGVGNEMSARLTEAHEQPISHNEWIAQARRRVGRRNIDVPAGKVFSVEQAPRLRLWRASDAEPSAAAIVMAGINNGRELITTRPVPVFSNRDGQWHCQRRIVCEIQNQTSVSARKKLEHSIAIGGGDIECACSCK